MKILRFLGILLFMSLFPFGLQHATSNKKLQVPVNLRTDTNFAYASTLITSMIGKPVFTITEDGYQTENFKIKEGVLKYVSFTDTEIIFCTADSVRGPNSYTGENEWKPYDRRTPLYHDKYGQLVFTHIDEARIALAKIGVTRLTSEITTRQRSLDSAKRVLSMTPAQRKFFYDSIKVANPTVDTGYTRYIIRYEK